MKTDGRQTKSTLFHAATLSFVIRHLSSDIRTLLFYLAVRDTVPVEGDAEHSSSGYDDFSSSFGSKIIVSDENVCDSSDPNFDKVPCFNANGTANVGPQAPANVTKGYNGSMIVDYSPLTTPFWMNGMCSANVHWHVGAEHLSVGEYDENGKGPEDPHFPAESKTRVGHLCHLYDETDPKFTTPYEWKYCKHMTVGQTYEVHWPHTAVGDCGTPYQYQQPFQDGLFCHMDLLTETYSQLGVQAQTFVVVNDEDYYYPSLVRGMLVHGEMGLEVTSYTGSTTGDSHNNEICSQYTPATWQVDRVCHLISASSFDKMCFDMMQQADDMSSDLHPHGSRETVLDTLASNNFFDIVY